MADAADASLASALPVMASRVFASRVGSAGVGTGAGVEIPAAAAACRTRSGRRGSIARRSLVRPTSSSNGRRGTTAPRSPVIVDRPDAPLPGASTPSGRRPSAALAPAKKGRGAGSFAGDVGVGAGSDPAVVRLAAAPSACAIGGFISSSLAVAPPAPSTLAAPPCCPALAAPSDFRVPGNNQEGTSRPIVGPLVCSTPAGEGFCGSLSAISRISSISDFLSSPSPELPLELAAVVAGSVLALGPGQPGRGLAAPAPLPPAAPGAGSSAMILRIDARISSMLGSGAFSACAIRDFLPATNAERPTGSANLQTGLRIYLVLCQISEADEVQYLLSPELRQPCVSLSKLVALSAKPIQGSSRSGVTTCSTTKNRAIEARFSH